MRRPSYRVELLYFRYVILVVVFACVGLFLYLLSSATVMTGDIFTLLIVFIIPVAALVLATDGPQMGAGYSRANDQRSHPLGEKRNTVNPGARRLAEKSNDDEAFEVEERLLLTRQQE
ncbi:hypothetical protein [Sphingomonas paeninsulae]|nr:hypothetical protein [Sphingomonas paeninsulae]